MKHGLLISFFCLYVICSNATQWVQKTALPADARSYANSFVINGKAYVGGGYNQNFVYLDDFWEYDPSNNSWTQKATLINTISGASCFTISGKGYLVNGWISGTNTNDVYEYDPVGNAWATKNPFPGPGRYLACSFEINNIGYIGLGYSPLLGDLWAYDPTGDSWTQKANFIGSSRQATVSFAINGIAYVGCGTNNETTYAALNDFYSYNPVANTWTQIGNFGGPARHSAFSFVGSNNKGYVGTGIDGQVGGSFYSDFYEFDPSNTSWTLLTDSFPGGRRGGATAFSINGCGYVFGGYYYPSMPGTFYNDLWTTCLSNGVEENDARTINVDYSSARKIISIDCGNYTIKNGSVKIYDLQGKCVLSSSLNNNHMELSFDNTAIGIYTYQVSDNNKLIKSGRLGM